MQTYIKVNNLLFEILIEIRYEKKSPFPKENAFIKFARL